MIYGGPSTRQPHPAPDPDVMLSRRAKDLILHARMIARQKAHGCLHATHLILSLLEPPPDHLMYLSSMEGYLPSLHDGNRQLLGAKCKRLLEESLQGVPKLPPREKEEEGQGRDPLIDRSWEQVIRKAHDIRLESEDIFTDLEHLVHALVVCEASTLPKLLDICKIEEKFILQLSGAPQKRYLEDRRRTSGEEELPKVAPMWSPQGGDYTLGVRLAQFCTDLTRKAEAGQLSERPEREDILNKLAVQMTHSGDQSCVLLGKTGVGKTAIVEEFARCIAFGRVPGLPPHSTRLLSLFAINIIAGTHRAGALKKRIGALVTEIHNCKRAGLNVIIFMDMIDSARSWDGYLHPDSTRLHEELRAAISCNEMVIIGTSLHQDWDRAFGDYPDFRRCFQIIDVEEPSIEQTAKMLEIDAREMAYTYDVEIGDDTIAECCFLAKNFWRQYPLPWTALRTLEESVQNANDERDKGCTGTIYRLKRKVASSRNHVRGFGSDAPKERIDSVLSTMDAAEREIIAAEVAADRWRKDEEEQLRYRSTVRRALEDAIEARDTRISCEDSDEDATDRQSLDAYIEGLRGQVDSVSPRAYACTSTHARKAIETLAHVQAAELSLAEKQKLYDLGDNLNNEVVGQPSIKVIARHLSNVLQDTGRVKPFCMMLVGPSGTGKTLLVTILAKHAFRDPHKMLHLTLAEWTQNFERVLGGPDTTGSLTEAINMSSRCIVILDNVDHIDQEILDALLQVIERGYLTNGRSTAEFILGQAIFVATATVGYELINTLEPGRPASGSAMTELKRQLCNRFSSNFMQQFDLIAPFCNLDDEAIDILIDRNVVQMRKRLEKEDGVASFEVRPSALAWLAHSIKEAGERNGRKIKHIVQGGLSEAMFDILILSREHKGCQIEIAWTYSRTRDNHPPLDGGNFVEVIPSDNSGLLYAVARFPSTATSSNVSHYAKRPRTETDEQSALIIDTRTLGCNSRQFGE